MIDLGILKAFADSAGDLHNSDHGARIEIFVFIWIVVRRFTKPISSAVQKLVAAHEANAAQLADHTTKLQDHEKRIGVLETGVDNLKPKPLEG